jgi:hypothetical protein
MKLQTRHEQMQLDLAKARQTIARLHEALTNQTVGVDADEPETPVLCYIVRYNLYTFVELAMMFGGINTRC